MSDTPNTPPETKEAPASAPEKPRAQRAPFGLVASSALAAAIIGGFIGAYGVSWIPKENPALTGLESKTTALENRVAALEARPAAAPVISGAPGEDMSARFSALEARVGGLESTLSNTATAEKAALDSLNARLGDFALKNEQADISARLAKVEEQNSAMALRRAAIALALGQLARATSGDEAFNVELNALEVAAPGDEAIALLKPYAQSGVPTQTMLAARFGDAARAALDAERAAAAGNFFSRLWVNLKSLISIRRVGRVNGFDTESRLARAGDDLNAGDLAAAVDEVKQIKGAAAPPLAAWLKDAEARVAIGHIVSNAGSRIVQSLNAQALPPSPAAAPETPAPSTP